MDKMQKLKAIQGLIIGLNEELYRKQSINGETIPDYKLIESFYYAIVELVNDNQKPNPNIVAPKNELISESSSRPLDVQGIDSNKENKGLSKDSKPKKAF